MDDKGRWQESRDFVLWGRFDDDYSRKYLCNVIFIWIIANNYLNFIFICILYNIIFCYFFRHAVTVMTKKLIKCHPLNEIQAHILSVSSKYFPKEVSIFTVDTCSTELTLNIVSTSNSKRILILSDSLSVISSSFMKWTSRTNLILDAILLYFFSKFPVNIILINIFLARIIHFWENYSEPYLKKYISNIYFHNFYNV